ncbi:hypothetical protein QTP86_008184 [Hemibagrus guttatus]|nr:hypothetical protein QTP86_008184 [Hemibagrus guttatus]
MLRGNPSRSDVLSGNPSQGSVLRGNPSRSNVLDPPERGNILGKRERGATCSALSEAGCPQPPDCKPRPGQEVAAESCWVFRLLHNIFSSLLNPPAPPSPSSLTAEDFATFCTEKIERICQTFTSPPTSSTSHSQHSTTPSLMQLSTVAAEEVLQITRSCNPTTCPLDLIPSAMLQTISPDLLPFITTIINGSLTSGHVPTVFKKARVIPILKKPALDLSDISNYRPNNLHDPNQSGFKAAHSTEKLHAARSANLSSVLILLDLSAAFDTVNHKTLLSTLRSLGICGTAWEWFASYLDGRSYQLISNVLKVEHADHQLLFEDNTTCLGVRNFLPQLSEITRQLDTKTTAHHSTYDLWQPNRWDLKEERKRERWREASLGLRGARQMWSGT